MVCINGPLVCHDGGRGPPPTPPSVAPHRGRWSHTMSTRGEHHDHGPGLHVYIYVEVRNDCHLLITRRHEKKCPGASTWVFLVNRFQITYDDRGDARPGRLARRYRQMMCLACPLGRHFLEKLHFNSSIISGKFWPSFACFTPYASRRLTVRVHGVQEFGDESPAPELKNCRGNLPRMQCGTMIDGGN